MKDAEGVADEVRICLLEDYAAYSYVLFYKVADCAQTARVTPGETIPTRVHGAQSSLGSGTSLHTPPSLLPTVQKKQVTSGVLPLKARASLHLLPMRPLVKWMAGACLSATLNQTRK